MCSATSSLNSTNDPRPGPTVPIASSVSSMLNGRTVNGVNQPIVRVPAPQGTSNPGEEYAHRDEENDVGTGSTSSSSSSSSSNEKNWKTRFSDFIRSDQLKRLVGIIACIAIASGLGLLVAGLVTSHGWLALGGALTFAVGVYAVSQEDMRKQLPNCMRKCIQ